MVSVAMATFNGEKYIEAQLDSILSQTILPDEIVISDDVSSDNTVKIVERYERENKSVRWTIIKNENNVGYVKNFLKAMSKCSEEIIILCDQDDTWESNKIEKTIGYYSDPAVLSVHNDINIVDINEKIIQHSALGYKKRLEKVELNDFFRHLYYCGMSSSYRRSLMPIVLSVNPDELPTHDWLVHAAAVCRGGFYKSAEVLSNRRFHGDNVALNLDKTERKGIKQRIDVVKYYCLHYKLLEDIYTNFGDNSEELKIIKKIRKSNQKRLNYLEKKSFIDAILNLQAIRYYPTKKAFISDLLYITNIF